MECDPAAWGLGVGENKPYRVKELSIMLRNVTYGLGLERIHVAQGRVHIQAFAHGNGPIGPIKCNEFLE